jgi:hypothetical protein
MPKPSVPPSIPTPKKSNKAGTPIFAPALLTKMLIKSKMDPTRSMFSAVKLMKTLFFGKMRVRWL